MAPDYIDHNRARGPQPRGGNGAVDAPRERGLNWTGIVATVLALIVLGIVVALLTGAG